MRNLINVLNAGQIALIFGIIVVVVAIIIVAWYITVSNNIKRMNIKIDEADSNIDVALTKRYDLLTKLFQATKGYMQHEKETLEKVVAMRQPKGNSADIHDKEAFANEVGRGLQAINVVVEQYPDLKASKNVAELQRATFDVEENLQAARRVYNSNVSVFNQYIIIFPNSIIGKKYSKREFFEIEEFKKQDVNFEF